MAQNDILRARFLFNVQAQPAAFDLHYKVENSGVTNEDDSCEALSELLELSQMQTFNSILANDVTFEGWRVNFVQGQDAFGPYVSQLASANGARTGHAIPLVSAAVVRLNQQDRPAKHNGRIYVPGISEGDTDKSLLTSVPVIDGIRDRLNDVILVDGVYQSINWAFQMVVRGGTRQAGFVHTPISSVQVQTQLGSQRRRITKEFGTFPS